MWFLEKKDAEEIDNIIVNVMTKVYTELGYVKPSSVHGTADTDLQNGDPRMRPTYFTPVFRKCFAMMKKLGKDVEDKNIQPPLFDDENYMEMFNTALMLTTYLTSPNGRKKMRYSRQYNYVLEEIEKLYPGED